MLKQSNLANLVLQSPLIHYQWNNRQTEAPNPMHIPPIALFLIVILSGKRHLNSFAPLAIYDPINIPNTKNAPIDKF